MRRCRNCGGWDDHAIGFPCKDSDFEEVPDPTPPKPPPPPPWSDAITVGDLIAELSKCDPTLVCVMQADQEGNGYGPLRGIDPECGYSGDGWRGEVKTWPSERTKDMDPGDVADPDDSYIRCLVLYP